MHLVRTIDWDAAVAPPAVEGRAEGYRRGVLVDRSLGATHTQLEIHRLAPGGWVDGHVHAFETAVYVLGGSPVLGLEGRRFQLRPADYALVPLGYRHSWANPGPDEVRWLSVSTPVRIPPDQGRRDTYFFPGPDDARHGPAERPVGAPLGRFIGHYAGTPPQAQALALAEPPERRTPAGMDTALLVYSGISVKMLVDRGFGADLLTMFTVDYEPGGAALVHDHPFEEAYVFLDGEIEAVLEGRTYTVRAGDVVFTSVGAAHGFFNRGSGRVRWIETQAPQPPVRHSYRWLDHWRRLDAEG
jgi:quercetin dioxygenase-like cupin family protein